MAEGASPPQVHVDRRAWLTLGAMCFALFMIMLDNTVVNVALPSIQAEFNADPGRLEWTLNAYVLAFAALIPLGGKLGDRFGRKRMFLVGIAIFTVSSLACGLAQSDAQLIGFRAVQGVGAALLNPLSLSIIVSAFPRPKIPQAIGIWAGISGLGLALGPLLGGYLTENVSWSWVFFINVPIGIVAAAVCVWAVRESSDPAATKLDLPGVVLLTLALFLLTYGVISTQDHSWLNPLIIGTLVVAAVLFAAFLWWEGRAEQPMMPLGFFKRRAFSVSTLIALLVGFAMFGVIFFITLYFQNVQGYSPMEAGVRSLPLTMMVLVTAPIAGRLNPKVGPQKLMVFGMISASIAMFGLSQLEPDSSYNAIWPFYILMGVGIALTMPALSATGMGAVPPTQSGIASGVINAGRQVGGALGIAILGAIGAKVTGDAWADTVSTLPAPAQGKAALLEPLVIGARGETIEQLSGSSTLAAAALQDFVDGMHWALLTGSVLCLLAAVVAGIGLRGYRPAPVTRVAPAAVEA